MKTPERDESIRRRRRALLLIVFSAAALGNAAVSVRLVPFLRAGYQDFTAFYCAGVIVRSEPMAHLYDLALQSSLQRHIAPDVAIRQAALPYTHPPFEALVFAPLSCLNYWPAYLMWTVANLVVAGLTMKILRDAFPEIRRFGWGFAVLAALAYEPLTWGIVQGQDAAVLMLVLTAALVWLRAGKNEWAGAALGMGLFKFHLALPLAAILAVKRPRLLVGFVPVAVGLAGVSGAMVGWNGLVGYTHLLFRLEQSWTGGVAVASMPNLRGLLAGLNGGRGVPMWMTGVCSVAAVGIAIWQIRVRRVPVECAFILAGVTAVMVSYHTVLHDLTFLFPFLFLLSATPDANGHQETNSDTVFLLLVYTMLLGSTLWPRLNPWWFVPATAWIYWKLGGERRLPVPQEGAA